MVTSERDFPTYPGHRELSVYDTVELMPFLELIPESPFEKERQSDFLKEYRENWFSPWQKNPSPPTNTQLLWGLNLISKGVFYRENKRAVDAVFLKKIKNQMSLEAFPNKQGLAVSVRYTHLRYIPDHGTIFETPDDFPFDVLQVTSIGPGTPLRVWHVSRDGLWVYVDAPFASGWVAVLDIANMTQAARDWIMSLSLYSVMKDAVAAVDSDTAETVLSLSVGQHYPVSKSDKTRIYVPLRQPGGQALWVLTSVPPGAIGPLGVGWSRDAVVKLVREVFGQPYGWGGLFYHRDCSAMIRDLVSPFGIWLPRNSSAQAKKGGRFVSLNGLDNAEKKRRIVSQGRPFVTLLWLKGHIMLYVGSPNGEPMALHNIWGVRVRDPQGSVQKVIIGRTVITDLEPGKSLPDFDLTQSLLSRIEGMTFLGE
jgi:hypothetical protein